MTGQTGRFNRELCARSQLFDTRYKSRVKTSLVVTVSIELLEDASIFVGPCAIEDPEVNSFTGGGANNNKIVSQVKLNTDGRHAGQRKAAAALKPECVAWNRFLARHRAHSGAGVFRKPDCSMKTKKDTLGKGVRPHENPVVSQEEIPVLESIASPQWSD